jgi:hypothetical protein
MKDEQASDKEDEGFVRYITRAHLSYRAERSNEQLESQGLSGVENEKKVQKSLLLHQQGKQSKTRIPDSECQEGEA